MLCSSVCNRPAVWGRARHLLLINLSFYILMSRLLLLKTKHTNEEIVMEDFSMDSTLGFSKSQENPHGWFQGACVLCAGVLCENSSQSLVLKYLFFPSTSEKLSVCPSWAPWETGKCDLCSCQRHTEASWGLLPLACFCLLAESLCSFHLLQYLLTELFLYHSCPSVHFFLSALLGGLHRVVLGFSFAYFSAAAYFTVCGSYVSNSEVAMPSDRASVTNR